jgi:hypothetical protein
MRARGLAGLGAALVLALVGAGSAHAESIVYVSDGDLWLTDVQRTVRLTNVGGFESPSQDSSGRIVAVQRLDEGEYTNRYVVRMNSSGRLLNDPVRAGQHNNSFFIGPLGAEVSPGGDLVAYHHFNHSPLIDENQRPRLSFGYVERNTDTTEIEDEGSYLNPTWIDNDRVAIFLDPDFNPDVQIYSLSGGSFTDWFSVDGVNLTSGDVSEDISRLAVVADGGGLFALYSLDAPPPAAPTFRCGADTPNGAYSNIVWSPDGTGLAWAENDGIHLATVGDLASCDLQEVALIPNGAEPYWGSADMPSTPVICDIRVPAKVSQRKALRAIPVPIDCPGADKARGKGRVSGEKVAKGSVALDEGKGKLKIKPTQDGKPLLRLAGKVKVSVNAGGKRFSRKVKIVD